MSKGPENCKSTKIRSVLPFFKEIWGAPAAQGLNLVQGCWNLPTSGEARPKVGGQRTGILKKKVGGHFLPPPPALRFPTSLLFVLAIYVTNSYAKTTLALNTPQKKLYKPMNDNEKQFHPMLRYCCMPSCNSMSCTRKSLHTEWLFNVNERGVV